MNHRFHNSRETGKRSQGRGPSRRRLGGNSDPSRVSLPTLPGFCACDEGISSEVRLPRKSVEVVVVDTNDGRPQRGSRSSPQHRECLKEDSVSNCLDGDKKDMFEVLPSASVSVGETGGTGHGGTEEVKVHAPSVLFQRRVSESAEMLTSGTIRVWRQNSLPCGLQPKSVFDSHEELRRSPGDSRIEFLLDDTRETTQGKEEGLKPGAQRQPRERENSLFSYAPMDSAGEDAKREKIILEAFNELSGDTGRLDLLYLFWNKHFQPFEHRRSYTADTWDELKRVGHSEKPCDFEIDRERLCVYITLLGRKYRFFPCSFLLRAIYIIVFWEVMYFFSPSAFSHGGLYFDTITTILFSGLLGCFISRFIPVPSLVFVIAAGILYGSIPRTGYLTSGITMGMRTFVNTFGIAVGVIRAGLSMNIHTLKRHLIPYLIFSILPLFAEALVHAFLCGLAYNYPNFTWTILEGFIVSSAAPGVLVPVLIDLQRKGYGTQGGPGMLILTSVSIEALLCMFIIQFLVAWEFATVSARFAIFAIPIQIIVGVVGGILLGVFVFFAVFYVLSMEGERISLGNGFQKCMTMRHATHVHHRCVILILLLALGTISAGRSVSCVGGGVFVALVMTITFNLMCLQGGTRYHMTLKTDVVHSFTMIWDYIAMPAMFALSGAGINIHEIFDRRYIGQSVGIILAGMVARFIVATLTPLITRMGFSWTELLFCGIGFLGKGSLQGAMGTVALIYATMRLDEAKTPEDIAAAQQQVNCASLLRDAAVLSTLIACPICSVFLRNFGERLLKRDTEELDIVMTTQT